MKCLSFCRTLPPFGGFEHFLSLNEQSRAVTTRRVRLNLPTTTRSIYPQPLLNSVFENMMDPTAALQNLTPEQKHAVMTQAQQQANQQIMSSMIESMTLSCFDKCAGVSGDRLDGKEQGW